MPELQGVRVWLKRAGPRHGMAGYRALGLLARLLRLPVLTPVPNRGGRAAIATEVRRLQELGQHGIAVPQVLATAEEGFLMADLGTPGRPTPSLAGELDTAWAAADSAAVLALWTQGLDTLARVHVESVRRHLIDVLTPEQLKALGNAMQAVRDANSAEGA